MIHEETLIRKYDRFIREIVNNSVATIDWDKLETREMMFNVKIQELFKFDNPMSWSFLTASLDVIGDSQYAIVSFINEKIGNGNTFNTGERYLRLYGVLSAVYIHFRAISTIAELVKVKDYLLEKSFKKLDISFLRNAISAHPVNYEINGEKTNYKIARYSVEDTNKIIIIDSQNNSTQYDIQEALNTYLIFAEKALNTSIKKLIRNRFGNSKDNENELLDKLKVINSSN